MNRQTAFQLLPIVALAATLRFWGLTFGLPNTDARPDEGRIVRVALWESESHRLTDRKTRPDWIAVEESPLRSTVFSPLSSRPS